MVRGISPLFLVIPCEANPYEFLSYGFEYLFAKIDERGFLEAAGRKVRKEGRNGVNRFAVFFRPLLLFSCPFLLFVRCLLIDTS